MLKPAGTFSFPSGSLSGAAASGGGATGASFCAASLSGRPIIGDPGGSGCAAGGLAGCCAAALNVSTPRKAPASKRLRGAGEHVLMVFSVLGSPRSSDGQTPAPAGGLRAGSLEYFSGGAQSKKFRNIRGS